jgi:hypothetical protein
MNLQWFKDELSKRGSSWEEFETAYKADGRAYNKAYTPEVFIKQQASSFRMILEQAFNWATSYQGSAYWTRIAGGLEHKVPPTSDIYNCTCDIWKSGCTCGAIVPYRPWYKRDT